jgi:bifunctional DNA-binding transcriptional regulator/antitoxin component of YhaV-PrlF toxin-antitoxin module
MEKLKTIIATDEHIKSARIEEDTMYVEEQPFHNLTSGDDGIIEPLPDIDWSNQEPVPAASIHKVVEPTGDLCVKFTDEELHRLGIKKGDKFSFKEDGEGFLLQKYATIEIDLEELSRETLEMMIKMSCDEDISINEVVSNIIEAYIEKHDKDKYIAEACSKA